MEYVKMTSDSQRFAKKSLLHAEMGLLNSMKHFQKYRELRKQELILKNEVRRQLAEVTEEFKVLSRHMPHAHIERPKVEDKGKATQQMKRRNDFEFEIEQIKQKLAQLG